jgi:hypothetical protein
LSAEQRTKPKPVRGDKAWDIGISQFLVRGSDPIQSYDTANEAVRSFDYLSNGTLGKGSELVLLPEPNECVGTVSKNLVHHANLGRLLDRVILINAYCVDT